MPYNFDTTYTELNDALYQYLDTLKLDNPTILLLNETLLESLGINYLNEELPRKLLGIDSSIHPIAQAYAGHQFGYFTILGDGRTMLLGEHVTNNNERFDIQLKGSGITTYSRGGDGKATCSSMIREYLYSYAMNNLNIETSQSVAVIETNEKVVRSTLHDGAILVRVMKSHIRFGTFEYVSKSCSKEEFKQFTDYVIKRHYPDLLEHTEKYLHFFQAVIKKSIQLVVSWLRVGFIHGVMNTDNMSITGETFDYGPCSFMNTYDPSKTYSEIDTHKRYSFGNQRLILCWNLTVFGITLLPLFHEDEHVANDYLNKTLDEFNSYFDSEFNSMMKGKLGITDSGSHTQLISSFLKYIEENELDYTNSFIELMYPGTFKDAIFTSKQFQDVMQEIQKVGLDLNVMKQHNPQRILRNYLVEGCLKEYEETNSLTSVKQILKAVFNPYERDDTLKRFQMPPAKEFDDNYTTHCNT